MSKKSKIKSILNAQQLFFFFFQQEFEIEHLTSDVTAAAAIAAPAIIMKAIDAFSSHNPA